MTINKNNICDICGNIYKNAHGLHIHKTNKHNKEVNEQRRQATVLMRKKHPSHAKQDCVCNICNKHCNSIASLKQHITCVHNEDNAKRISESRRNGIANSESYRKQECKCDICGNVLHSIRGLHIHMTSVHDPKVHEAICNKNKGRKRGAMSEATKEKLRIACSGRKHTAEELAKMSAKAKGRHFSSEHKAKIGAGNKGKRLSDETKAKISCSVRKRVNTPEVKHKASVAQSKRAARGDNNPRGIRSVLYNKNNESVKCDSTYEAKLCNLMLLDDNIVNFNRCKDRIVYTFNSIEKRYNPDFIVYLKNGMKVIVEVKAAYALNDALVIAKAHAAQKYYCNLYVLITEREMSADMQISDILLSLLRQQLLNRLHTILLHRLTSH